MRPTNELYELDWWIRQSLRDTHDPNKTLAIMKEALWQNATELGFIERADGSWLFAGEWAWGPGITTVEKAPKAAWMGQP